MSQQPAVCSKINELEQQLANNTDYANADTIASEIEALKKGIDNYNKACAQNKYKASVPAEAQAYMGNGGRRSGKKSRRNSKKRKTLRKKTARRKTRSHKQYLFF